MAKVGRKPKPTTLRLLQGNAGKRPINEEEPQPAKLFTPGPPRHFGKLECAKWRQMCRVLSAARVLTVMDLDALEIYCVNWVAMHEALNDISARGKLLRTPGGNAMWNPSWTHYKHAERVCRSLQAEFGLTPSSRTGVVASADSEGKDQWDSI